MKANQIYSAYRPHKDDTVTYKGVPVGKVSRVEGNLCWLDNNPDKLFIWCFHDGLNKFHKWPTKDNGKCAP